MPAGDRIEYYIGENDGELPPGIELGRTTGKLTGVVETVFALEKRAGSVTLIQTVTEIIPLILE